jgi:hypothetical protein
VGNHALSVYLFSVITIIAAAMLSYRDLSATFYSNFPSVNSLIGTCSLLSLSLLNISADDCCCGSFFISILVTRQLTQQPSHLFLLFNGKKL